MRSRRMFGLALWITGVIAEMTLACPNCSRSLDESGPAVPFAFFCSILFMLSMPFLLTGAFAGYFYLLSRSAMPAVEDLGNAAPFNPPIG